MKFQPNFREIEIGDSKYKIAFTLSVLEEIQERYGEIEILKHLNSVRELRWILKTLINLNGGDITEEDINANIMGATQFAEMINIITETFIGDLPESDDDTPHTAPNLTK